MIPAHICKFLQDFIKSIWAIDLLRLMKKTPGQSWSVQALTSELRGSVPMVEAILRNFVRSGLVSETENGGYRYAAEAPLDALVAEMLQLYAERPVAVISEIAASPADKIQTFVDAFRLKKD